MSEIVCLNGKIVPSEDAKISVFDHGFLYGDGIYETIQWQNGKLKNFTNHYARLQNSAKLLQLEAPYSAEELRRQTDAIAKSDGIGRNLRIRITITRGINNFDFSQPKQPTVLVSAHPLKNYGQERQQGVKVITTPKLARVLPNCKHTSLIAMIHAKQLATQQNAFEVIFCNDEIILEGSICNISYLKNNTLHIAPKNLVLAGTTQKVIVEQIAPNLNWQVSAEAFTAKNLLTADAVWLTNAVYQILPVIAINGEPIKTHQWQALTQQVYQLLKKNI